MFNLNEKYVSISERCGRNHQNKFCLRPLKGRLGPWELSWVFYQPNVYLAQYSIEMSIAMEFLLWKFILPVIHHFTWKEKKMPFEVSKGETFTLKSENSMILLWHDFVVLHEKLFLDKVHCILSAKSKLKYALTAQPVYFIIISSETDFFIRMWNWDYSEIDLISHCFKVLRLLSADFTIFTRFLNIFFQSHRFFFRIFRNFEFFGSEGLVWGPVTFFAGCCWIQVFYWAKNNPSASF